MKTNKLYIAYDLLRHYLFGHKIPLFCHFSLTNKCEFNCLYCGVSKRKIEELNTHQVQAIIAQLACLGNKRLHFTGGEPLLRDDLRQIIEFSKKRNLYVSIASSGYDLVNKWEDIKYADSIFLSFDGPKEIHEQHRGKNSFDCFNEAKIFLNKKNKKFFTTTVISRFNKDYLEQILEEAVRFNFIANFFLIYQDSSPENLVKSLHKYKLNEQLTLSAKEKKEVIAHLIKLKKGKWGKFMGTSLSFLRYLLDWEDLNQTYASEKRGLNCKAGSLFYYIDSNADLYACGEIMSKISGVNLLTKKLSHALKLVEQSKCKGCVVGCYVEQNMILNFNLSCICNWLSRTKYE